MANVKGKPKPKPKAKPRMSQQQRDLIRMNMLMRGMTGPEDASAFQGGNSGGGGSGISLSPIKKLGSFTLGALSVPVASAWTLGAKAAGKDISWKSAGGDFYTSKSGKKGLDNAMSSVGISNRWAQLGISIATDPLWLLGGGTINAGVKIARGGKALAEASRAAETARTATSADDAVGIIRRAAASAERAPLRATQPRSSTKLGRPKRGDAVPRRDTRFVVDRAGNAAPPGKKPMLALPAKSESTAAREAAQSAIPVLEREQRTAKEVHSVTKQLQKVERSIRKARKTGKREHVRDLIDARDSLRERLTELNTKLPSPKALKDGARELRRLRDLLGKDTVEPRRPSTSTRRSKAFREPFPEGGSTVQRAFAALGKEPPRGRPRSGSPGAGAPPASAAQKAAQDLEAAVSPFIYKNGTPSNARQLFESANRASRGEQKVGGKTVKLSDAELNSPKFQREAQILKEEAELLGRPLEETFALDKFGNPLHHRANFRAVRDAGAKAHTRPNRNFAVRLGAGRLGVKINTGISAERALVGRMNKLRGALAPGRVSMKPVEKIAHMLRRSATESKQGAAEAQLRTALETGIATREGKKIVVDEKKATLIGMFRAAVSLNSEMGKELRGALKARGLWDDSMDEFVRVADERTDYLSIAMGYREPGAKPFAGEIAKLEDEISGLKQQIREAPTTGIAEDLMEQVRKLEAKQRALVARGMYARTRVKPEDVQAMREFNEKQFKKGNKVESDFHPSQKAEETVFGEREFLDDPFEVVAQDGFMDELVNVGLSERQADEVTSIVDALRQKHGFSELGAKAPTIRTEKGIPETHKWRPEWNSSTLMDDLEQAHIDAALERELKDLMEVAGLDHTSALGQAVMGSKYSRGFETVGGGPGGRALQKTMHVMKGTFTFLNMVPHTMNNYWGDFMNSLYTGNWRHASPGGAAFYKRLPGNELKRLANAGEFVGRGKVDEEVLNKMFKVGKREMSGRELLALSRMSGMGTGYVHSDIAIMNTVFESTSGENMIKRLGKFAWRGSQRFQLRRENAQRLASWVKHMKAGDDPMTAASKTVRTIFDYGELTQFEKVWARNMVFFYTWLKKNMILQTQGLAMRPAVANNTINAFEHARPKFQDEPEYYARQGAVPVPFMNSITLGTPQADIFKWDMNFDSFRKEVLGIVTPPLRLPFELGLNKTAFTGADISRYPGERRPGGIANLLAAASLGNIPDITGPTRDSISKQMVPGLESRTGYLISQLFGPYAAHAERFGGAQEGQGSSRGLMGLLGIRPQVDDPEKFARNKKLKEAREKANKTRRKNAQGGK